MKLAARPRGGAPRRHLERRRRRRGAPRRPRARPGQARRDGAPRHRRALLLDGGVVRRAGRRDERAPALRHGAAPVETVARLVGSTPLVRLRRIGAELPGIRIYAKCEFMNPGGSVKDRPALRMIEAALARRPLRPGAHARRLDERQHRRRLRLDLRRARAPLRARHAAQRERGAQAHRAGVRRRARLLGSAGGLRRRHPPGARARGGRAGPLVLPGPVREPGEPARARARDRGGDRRGARRRGRGVRRRASARAGR